MSNNSSSLASSCVKWGQQLDDLQSSSQLHESNMELYFREESKTRRISKVIQDLKVHFASRVRKKKRNRNIKLLQLLHRLKELNIQIIVKIIYVRFYVVCANTPSNELNVTKRQAEFDCLHGPKCRGQFHTIAFSRPILILQLIAVIPSFVQTFCNRQKHSLCQSVSLKYMRCQEKEIICWDSRVNHQSNEAPLKR